MKGGRISRLPQNHRLLVAVVALCFFIDRSGAFLTSALCATPALCFSHLSTFRASRFRFGRPVMKQTAESLQDRDFQAIPLQQSSVSKLGPLSNRYFGLRHGESYGNVQNVISSHPVQGTLIHGLTKRGQEQAKSAAPLLVEAIGGVERMKDLVVLTSNFTRARETAAEVVAALSSVVNDWRKEVIVETALRERWFGELDNTIITNYNKVWPADLKDASCTNYGVESVDQVCERLRGMMLKLEATYSNKNIVLVSHADTLQILQTYVAGVDPRTFSQYRFKNGEVRALLQDPASLPEPAPLVYSP